MKHALLLTTCLFAQTYSSEVLGQCTLGAPCNDSDTCTTNDVVTSVIPGIGVCAPGVVEFPDPSSTWYSDTLSPEEQQIVSPYLHDLPAKEWRKQFMFLRSELDVQLNQTNGHPDATQGLGTCEPITAISFWVNDTVTAAMQKPWIYAITVKHAPEGVNDLSLGFDGSTDPAAGCANGLEPLVPSTVGPPGWNTFQLTSPFQWNGVNNVIVELAVNSGNLTILPAPLSVRYTRVEGEAPANQLTYVVVGIPPYLEACAPTGREVCGQNSLAAALPSTAPCYTIAGSSDLRPAILFTSGVVTAPPATCTCEGTAADTDGDGVPDCNDNCPAVPGQQGDACDDGDANTVDDVIDINCVCAGTIGMGVAGQTTMTGLRAWPLPASGGVLFLDRAVTGQLVNMDGRVVRVITRASQVDLSELAPGVYVLHTTANGTLRVLRD